MSDNPRIAGLTYHEAAFLDVKLAYLKFGRAEAERIAAKWQRNVGVDAAKLVMKAAAAIAKAEAV